MDDSTLTPGQLARAEAIVERIRTATRMEDTGWHELTHDIEVAKYVHLRMAKKLMHLIDEQMTRLHPDVKRKAPEGDG